MITGDKASMNIATDMTSTHRHSKTFFDRGALYKRAVNMQQIIPQEGCGHVKLP